MGKGEDEKARGKEKGASGRHAKSRNILVLRLLGPTTIFSFDLDSTYPKTEVVFESKVFINEHKMLWYN